MTNHEDMTLVMEDQASIYSVTPDPAKSCQIYCGVITNDKTHFYQKEFFRNQYTGSYILHGTGKYSHEKGSVSQLKPGDFYQQRPGMGYSVTPNQSQKWLELFVSIPAGFYHILEKISLFPDQPILHPGVNKGLMQKAAQILEQMRSAERTQPGQLVVNIQQYFWDVFQVANQASSHYSDGKIIQLAISKLTDNFAHEDDFEQLAERLEISYDRLRKLFKKHTGMTLGQYRQNLRVDKASSLLTNSDLNLTVIADHIGYADIHSFSKQFKKGTGLSPREFRKKYKL